MTRLRNRLQSAWCACLFLLVILPNQGRAGMIGSYDFRRITANATTNVAGQLTMEVWDTYLDYSPLPSTHYALFNFRNFQNGGTVQSSITGVYFDDGTLLHIADVLETSGSSPLNFTQGGPPSDLPSGNTVGFTTTASFLATSDNKPGGNITNGVNEAGDILGILFSLQDEYTAADVLTALETGELRVGLHVQSIPDGAGGTTSDSFVTPLPASILLGIFAVGLASRTLRKFV
jgi:hypothetical protein